jgi:hypothetical protein
MQARVLSLLWLQLLRQLYQLLLLVLLLLDLVARRPAAMLLLQRLMQC